jgi:hypothetical protein
MGRVIFVRLFSMLVAAVALAPIGAQAQSGISGVVRDSSAAVLPGVTVEASSPALIEKVRTVVTDREGLYRLIDLRPGIYTVTFSLPGFATVRREAIELGANFIANVNAEMRVGGIEETLTVSGQTPVVDIQSTQQQAVMTKELLESIPSARSWATNTVPAVARGIDVGGSGTMLHANLKVYGSFEPWNEVQVDGMSMIAAAGYPGVYYNYDSFEEAVYQIGGGTAEATSSGVIVNLIPRQGGNEFHGDATGLYSNHSFQASNDSEELRARGLRSQGGVDELHDVNASLGGPIKTDKVWFFGSVRNWKTNSYIANAFNPDGSRAIDDYLLYNLTGRITYQLSQRNKISGMYDMSKKNQGHRGFGPGFSPEAAFKSWTPVPQSGNSVLKFTSTASSKLLIESAFSTQFFELWGVYRPEVELPSATNPWGAIAKRDLILGRTWNAAPGGETYLRSFIYHVNSSITYVTGSHSIKIGEQFGRGYGGSGTVNQHGSMVQQYRNGTPDSVIAYNTPTNVRTDLDLQLGLFAQDSWTLGRLTLNPGIRLEIHRNSIPVQTAAAGRFVPERQFASIPGIVSWTDWNPRIGGVYDAFGNGRTAIKASIGRYPLFEQTSTAAQYNPMTAVGGASSNITDQRTWNDRNNNDIAEDDELGPPTNNRFGLGVDRTLDPDLDRPYSWMTSVGVQQELRPGMGLSVTYNRQVYRQLVWTDNLDTSFADYTLINIPDPTGSGGTLPIYNLNVNKRGLVSSYGTNSDHNRRLYDGVDIALNTRFRNGTVAVSSSTGRTRDIRCEVDDPNDLRFCDETELDIPYLTSFRIVGTYQLPYAIRLSGVFQSTPGGSSGQPIYGISYIVNRTIVPTLTNPSVTVRLDEPGSQRYEQINQLDFAIGREFQVGKVRLTPKVEIANTLNVNPITTQVTTFGSAFGTPQGILPGRVARINVAMKF